MNEYDRQRWRNADDAARAGRLFAIYKLMGTLGPALNLPKGVHKFHSFEEMRAFRKRFEDERIARIRESNK